MFAAYAANALRECWCAGASGAARGGAVGRIARAFVVVGRSMTNLACVLWWLVPGVFLGWLLSWLFDLLFRRNGQSLIDTAKSELAAVQAKANGLESDLTVSRSQLSNFANDATRLRSELSASRTAHDEAKGSLGQLKSELDTRNASLASYATDLSSLQSQFSNARQSYAQLEAALTTVRAELDTSKRTAASAQSTTEATAAELNRLKSELASAVGAKDTLARSLTAFETERATAKTSQADTSAANERLLAELAAAKSGHANAVQALATLQRDFDASKTAVTSSSGELENLRAQLASSRAEYERSLAAKAAELDQIKSNFAAARTNTGSFDALQSQFTSLKGTHEATERSLAQLYTEHATFKARASELELQLGSERAKGQENQSLIALPQSEIESNKRANSALAGRAADMERAAHVEAERRIIMTRNGFVPRSRDRDDLTLVEGVGPKIEEVLLAAGIDTHAKLAVTPVEELRRILDAAGPQFNRANPATWARQAALAVRSDWAELRRWQDELIAGVEIPKSGV